MQYYYYGNIINDMMYFESNITNEIVKLSEI